MKSNSLRRKLVVRLIEHSWCNVLETTEVHLTDTFIGAGGDSLKTVEFTDELRRQLGVDLPIENLVTDNLGEICEWAVDNSNVSILPLLLKTCSTTSKKKAKFRHEQKPSTL